MSLLVPVHLVAKLRGPWEVAHNVCCLDHLDSDV